MRARGDQHDAERMALAKRGEAQRRRAAELESILAALRSREITAVEAERRAAAESAALADQLLRARDEAARREQEARSLRSRLSDMELEAQRRQREGLAVGGGCGAHEAAGAAGAAELGGA